MYGPLPAEVELRNDSALSDLSAPTEAVPPCALTSFELTMPSDVFVTITGMAGLAVAEWSTTPYAPLGFAVTPASRKDGLPFRLTRRLNEKTTSADVSGVPSENLMSLRSVKVKVLASFVAVHEVATSGSGCATSPPLNFRS